MQRVWSITLAHCTRWSPAVCSSTIFRSWKRKRGGRNISRKCAKVAEELADEYWFSLNELKNREAVLASSPTLPKATLGSESFTMTATLTGLRPHHWLGSQGSRSGNLGRCSIDRFAVALALAGKLADSSQSISLK